MKDNIVKVKYLNSHDWDLEKFINADASNSMQKDANQKLLKLFYSYTRFFSDEFTKALKNELNYQLQKYKNEFIVVEDEIITHTVHLQQKMKLELKKISNSSLDKHIRSSLAQHGIISLLFAMDRQFNVISKPA